MPGGRLLPGFGVRLLPGLRWVDNALVGEERVCALCQTVNVAGTQLCIACGSSFAASPPSVETAGEEDLDSAARQATVIEGAVPGGGVAKRAAAVVATAAEAARPQSPPETEHDPVGAPTTTKFTARLLLPDGDRRSLELTDATQLLGSGLDDLGVTGDPRIGSGEATLTVEDGDLYLTPKPDARGIYRRLRGEETLSPGDVVLMGDIAARYEPLEPLAPIDDGQQVLGGGANSPVGRLVFLRRDGTDGPVHDLPAGKTIIGRTDGHLNFPHDGRLSRRHARFFGSERGVTIEDLGSRNGTYLRLWRRERLDIGDALRVGSAGLQVKSRS